LATAGVVGGCAIVEGLPLVLVGVGLLLRRNWARVFALVFAVLFWLQGVALVISPPSTLLLVLGVVLVAHSVLSFVALLGRSGSRAFAAPGPVESERVETGVTMTTSQTPAAAPVQGSRVALAVLAAALFMSILATVVLALRPVSFALVAPAGA